MSLNVSEYGLAFNLNVNFDLSAATSLLLEFLRPDLTVFTGVPTAPAVPILTDDQGTFSANQYARYVFQQSDLTVPGDYIVRLIYMDAGPKRLVSEPASFEVYP